MERYSEESSSEEGDYASSSEDGEEQPTRFVFGDRYNNCVFFKYMRDNPNRGEIRDGVDLCRVYMKFMNHWTVAETDNQGRFPLHQFLECQDFFFYFLNQFWVLDISGNNSEVAMFEYEAGQVVAMRRTKLSAFLNRKTCLEVPCISPQDIVALNLHDTSGSVSEGRPFASFSKTSDQGYVPFDVVITTRQKTISMKNSAGGRRIVPGVPLQYLSSEAAWYNCSTNKRYVKEFVFDPRQLLLDTQLHVLKLNLYTGLPQQFRRETLMSLRKDNWNIFNFDKLIPYLNHLRLVWCENDAQYYRLIRVLARMVQCPWLKSQNIEWLHGIEGTGKTWFFEQIMVPILGKHGSLVFGGVDVLSRFTSVLDSKVMVVMDEDTMHNTNEISTLKNLATSKSVRIEKKFSDVAYIEQPTSYFLITNRLDHSLGPNDRRVCLYHTNLGALEKHGSGFYVQTFEKPTEQIDDDLWIGGGFDSKRYFDSLIKSINHNLLQTFAFFFLNVPNLVVTYPERLPVTEAYLSWKFQMFPLAGYHFMKAYICREEGWNSYSSGHNGGHSLDFIDFMRNAIDEDGASLQLSELKALYNAGSKDNLFKHLGQFKNDLVKVFPILQADLSMCYEGVHWRGLRFDGLLSRADLLQSCETNFCKDAQAVFKFVMTKNKEGWNSKAILERAKKECFSEKECAKRSRELCLRGLTRRSPLNTQNWREDIHRQEAEMNEDVEGEPSLWDRMQNYR